MADECRTLRDASGEPLFEKYRNVAVMFTPSIRPDLVCFERKVGPRRCCCLPFFAREYQLCVVIKQKEGEDLSKLLSIPNIAYHYGGSTLIEMDWLVGRYANVKVFLREVDGCCCATLGRARTLLTKGDDFDCADGFSLL